MNQPPRCTWRYTRNQLGGSVSGALLLDRRQGCGPECGGHTLVRDSLAHRNVGPVRQPAADSTSLHVAVVARATTQFRVVHRKTHLGPCPAVRPRRPLFPCVATWLGNEPTAPFPNRLVGMASAERANPKIPLLLRIVPYARRLPSALGGSGVAHVERRGTRAWG